MTEIYAQENSSQMQILLLHQQHFLHAINSVSFTSITSFAVVCTLRPMNAASIRQFAMTSIQSTRIIALAADVPVKTMHPAPRNRPSRVQHVIHKHNIHVLDGKANLQFLHHRRGPQRSKGSSR